MGPAAFRLAPVATASSLVSSSACAGKEVLDLGGDAAQVTPEGGGSGGDATTDGSSGGSSGGGGGGSSGGVADGGVVPGDTFPCNTNVCSAPDVCCEQAFGQFTCEAASACNGVAVGCTSTTCPTGSLCCASIQGNANGTSYTGWARCVETTTCPGGTQQVCYGQQGNDCPPGYYCDPGGFPYVYGCSADAGGE